MNRYSFLDNADIGTWLGDPLRPTTLTKKNATYIVELKQLRDEFAQIAIITYFLLKYTNNTGVRAMCRSARKQRLFVEQAITDLKKYGVTKEYERVFERNIDSLKRRVEYVYPIIKENVRLTEYYPYFEARGFDRLTDYSMLYNLSQENELQKLLDDMTQWMDRHTEQISVYADTIKPEVEKIQARKKAIYEADKMEKRLRKEKRKAENAEVAEIRKNERLHQSRNKKIDRSFARYYKDSGTPDAAR